MRSYASLSVVFVPPQCIASLAIYVIYVKK